jgi:uncharacterized membrane protein
MNNFTSSSAGFFIARACVVTALTVVAVALLTAKQAHAEAAANIDQPAPVVSRHDVDIDAPLSTVWAVQTPLE